MTIFFKVIKLMAGLKYLPSRQIACSQNVFCDPVLDKYKTHPLQEMGVCVCTIVVPCSRVLLENHMVLEFLILEGGTDRLSQNVNKELPPYAA